jgi:hypothetical protein
MFDFLTKNAAIAVMGSKWCNQPLPKTNLDVSQNKASEYLSLASHIRAFLSSNLKTLSDKALDPIIADLSFKNEIQATLNLQLLNSSQALSTYNTLNSFIVSKLKKSKHIPKILNKLYSLILNEEIFTRHKFSTKQNNSNNWRFKYENSSNDK